MKEKEFSQWIKWNDRNCSKYSEDLGCPGVYAIQYSEVKKRNLKFCWKDDICYIGETHSQKGLIQRLNQFNNVLRGGTGHGGAERFFLGIYKKQKSDYKDKNNDLEKKYKEIIENLYFAIISIKCDDFNMKTISPKDLRTLGDIRKLEYECLAKYKEARVPNSSVPRFNDPANKKSKVTKSVKKNSRKSS
ncbi:MAG: hypothetical protein PHV17_06805 [Candidatus Omnitrophica bacterium]|nr:hypothetical protein [Candidatus Omnitrophota bacterium]